MAFLNQGLTIVLHDERPSHKQEMTFSYRRRHRRLRAPPQRAKEPLFTTSAQFTTTDPRARVEVAWQWNTGYHEGPARVRQRHLHHRRRDARRGVQARAHAGDQPVRQRPQPVEGEGPNVPGRRRARRADRDRRRCKARRPAVRGADEGEARQHRDPFARRDGPRTNTSAGGSRSTRTGEGDRREGLRRGAGARGARSSAASSRGARPRSTACGMPDKLADCASNDAERHRAVHRRGRLGRRLGARRPRPPQTQAILPLRGKILNVERARMDKMVANTEIQALIAAIGGGIGDDFESPRSATAR